MLFKLWAVLTWKAARWSVCKMCSAFALTFTLCKEASIAEHVASPLKHLQSVNISAIL